MKIHAGFQCTVIKAKTGWKARDIMEQVERQKGLFRRHYQTLYKTFFGDDG